MELVDRERLIAQYSANSETKGFIELALDDCVVEALKRAEVIDAAPVVHGRWILADDGDGDVCSVCGTDFCNIIYETGNWNYCPNCGAKME